MEPATALTPTKINRLLPYWAVLQTDLRQTFRGWTYRLWLLVTILAAAGFLLYRVGVHNEAGLVRSAAAQSGDLDRLVFLGSLALVFIEIWCAFSLVKGRNWARWIYLLTQIIAAGYLWAASLGYGYPELFSIPGESKREIFHSLVMQKLPDLLVLTLLFVPANCRRFFRLQ